MGANCSKIDSDGVVVPSIRTANGLTTSLSAGDLRSYIAECQSDTELQNFDVALREQTRRVISTFSDNGEVRSLSVDSLRALNGCCSEVNQEVFKYVRNSQQDVWKSPELLDLVQQYFAYSDLVLTFFNALNTCLKNAHQRLLIIKLALLYFEEDSKDAGDGVQSTNSARFERTMKELKNFKEQGSPFSEEFGKLLQSILAQQKQMLFKLRAQRKKIDEKMKSVKTYKKVSLVIFAACFVGVIIFSVVAAAIAAPPVVAALAAAVSAPMGGMGKWLNSLWKKYENQLKVQADMIDDVKMKTLLTVAELEQIKLLISKVESEIERLTTDAEFSLRDDSTVVVVIGDVSNRLEGFAKAIASLEEQANTYSCDIRHARTLILDGMRRRSERS